MSSFAIFGCYISALRGVKMSLFASSTIGVNWAKISIHWDFDTAKDPIQAVILNQPSAELVMMSKLDSL
jgi:hypothetical protein